MVYLLSGRDVTKDAMFWVVATTSGFLGLAISFTSMWFLHQTGPTTYRYFSLSGQIKHLIGFYISCLMLRLETFFIICGSLVGSLNKVPISLAGLVLFKVPLSLPNLFSILFGK